MRSKRNIVIAAVVTLLPALFGIFAWNSFPEFFGSWGAGNTTKLLAVFGTPVIFLAGLIVCIFCIKADRKNAYQSRQVLNLVLWIMPFASIFSSLMIYSTVMNGFSFGRFFPVALGLMFAVIGNYLPKAKQNSTIGIRVSWTMSDEENWNMTHRFSGKLWLAGGLAMMLTAALPESISVSAFMVIAILISVLPVIYSYMYAKKRGKRAKLQKIAGGKISTVLLAAVTALAVILLCTGNINIEAGEEELVIKADFWTDSKISYGEIDSVEYLEGCDYGSRTFGLGTFRLAAGAFSSDELGDYTRYSYVGTEGAAAIRSGEELLIVSLESDEETKALCDLLSDKIK